FKKGVPIISSPQRPNVKDVLQRVAGEVNAPIRFSDEQVDVVVDGLTSLIEPLIIAFLGIVIGGIVVCMFLPIFKMSTLIKA
ncbi:MAG: hypothetical protein KJ983_02600, partial [Candidatus Omnitrophica bacterium]|nr:hypothetical protein [Candidatus Omnitrophota bacterium]